jgi:hypothetical protein
MSYTGEKTREVLDRATPGGMLFFTYVVLAPLAAFILGVCWPVALPVGFLALWGLTAVAFYLLSFLGGS